MPADRIAPAASPALVVVQAAVPNFRDIGGLATPSGTVRPGVVYRSAALSRLAPQTQQALVALGVTQAFDLRTVEEAEHRPDSLPAGVALAIEDVLADRPHSGAAEVASLVNQYEERASVERINAAVSGGLAEHHMRETYRHLVTLPSAHAGYGALLARLAVGDGASVVHCTAGKDRTGWAVAVLQLLAGAGRDDVMADYLLSNEPMRRTYGPMLAAFADEGGDADALAHMMLVYPEYLQTALDVVESVHGGLEGYLRGPLGLARADLDALRTRLVG